MNGAEIWTAIVASVLTSIVCMGTVLPWVWRRFVKALARQVAEVLAQVKGNGGDTTGTGDRLMRVEANQRALLEAQGITPAAVEAQMAEIQAEKHARPTPTP